MDRPLRSVGDAARRPRLSGGHLPVPLRSVDRVLAAGDVRRATCVCAATGLRCWASKACWSDGWKWDRLTIGPFTREPCSSVPTLSVAINKADDRASVIFAAGALLVMVSLYSLLIVGAVVAARSGEPAPACRSDGVLHRHRRRLRADGGFPLGQENRPPPRRVRRGAASLRAWSAGDCSCRHSAGRRRCSSSSNRASASAG